MTKELALNRWGNRRDARDSVVPLTCCTVLLCASGGCFAHEVSEQVCDGLLEPGGSPLCGALCLRCDTPAPCTPTTRQPQGWFRGAGVAARAALLVIGLYSIRESTKRVQEDVDAWM